MQEKTPNLLDYFPQNYRGPASNVILEALRHGCVTVNQVDSAIRLELGRRRVRQLGAVFEIYAELIISPNWTDLLREAVEYYTEWEKKTLPEKAKIKKQRGSMWVEMYMKEKPPTEKQLAFLKKNGVEVIPSNRLDASQMIDQIINSK